jgi:predicted transposase YbfD/YdcC
MRFTRYFEHVRRRRDRAAIRLEWIEHVIAHAEREEIQRDGRIRRWARIAAMDGRYLRVILLPDGETVHNAFFDRSFRL